MSTFQLNVDPMNPYLIANNPPDTAWIAVNERKYRSMKSHLQFDMRICIEIPNDANEQFRKFCKKLNDSRPFYSVDRLSKQKRQEIQKAQKECMYLWIMYWCRKIIEQKTSVPAFLAMEQLYKTHFEGNMSVYLNAKITDNEWIFHQFIHKLPPICSCIHNEDPIISIRKMHKMKLILLVFGAIKRFQSEVKVTLPHEITALISNILIDITLLPLSLELLNYIIGGDQAFDNLCFDCDGISLFLAELIEEQDHRVLEFCANRLKKSSKLPITKWTCSACGYLNDDSNANCQACTMDKPDGDNEVPQVIDHERLNRFFKENDTILQNLQQLLSKIKR